jgi:hypothetical protein
MALAFACPCGQQLMAAPEHAGQPIECPKCGQSTVAPAAAQPVAPQPDPNAKPWQKADPHPAATTQTTGGSIEGRVFNSGMAGGAAAMAIAVIWFVVGLAADRIFFYPPILFIIGLVAFFKGMMEGPTSSA